MTIAHGPNIGHGFTKYIALDANGVEYPPVVIASVVARAGRRVQGALTQADTVEADGQSWWVGEDALLSPNARTLLAQERLTDPAFIPALVRAALKQLHSAGKEPGYCVSGLPATWASDQRIARQLGERLRAATDRYTGIRVIAEPLGLIYSALLDKHGAITGDEALSSGTVGVVDLGHHTVDVAAVRKLVPVPSSLNTFSLGTARPLREIRAQLSARFERELSILETDLAARVGTLRVAGTDRPLPAGWDKPLCENGEAISARLVEEWGSGSSLDVILVGGGGAEERRLITEIRRRFPHTQVVEQPQTAVARGYARLARRLGGAP